MTHAHAAVAKSIKNAMVLKRKLGSLWQRDRSSHRSYNKIFPQISMHENQSFSQHPQNKPIEPSNKTSVYSTVKVLAFIIGFLEIQIVFFIFMKFVGVPAIIIGFLVLEIIALSFMLKKFPKFPGWGKAIFWGNITGAVFDLIAFIGATSAILGALSSISNK